MPKYYPQLKASLENITNVKPGENFNWLFTFKCSNCQEEHKSVMGVDPNEKSEIQGSRGEAMLVVKCKFCKKSGNCDLELENLVSYDIENNYNFKTIISLECRGLEPLTWVLPKDGLTCEGEGSGTKFDIDFSDGDWADYDEKNNESVSMSEIETCISKKK